MVGALIAAIGRDAYDAGIRPRSTEASRAAAPSLEQLAVGLAGRAEVAEAFVIGVDVWTRLFGVISFELFGHLVGVVDDVDAYFAYVIDELASRMGL
jgi:hypothetical protein